MEQQLNDRLEDVITQIQIIENGITAANEILAALKTIAESNSVLLKQISDKLTDYHLEDMRINESIKATVGTIDGQMKNIISIVNDILTKIKKLFPWIPKPREMAIGNGKIETVE